MSIPTSTSTTLTTLRPDVEGADGAATPALDRRLADLLDRTEIATLVDQVGLYLDEGRFDDLRSILTDDVTVSTPGGVAEGADAAIAQASRNHKPDEPIQHLLTDVIIDLAGDEADVRANSVVTFAPTAEVAELRRMGGGYHFGVRRTAAGWRFTRITATPVWREGPLVIAPAVDS